LLLTRTGNGLNGKCGTRRIGVKIIDSERLNAFCDANPKLGVRIRVLAEKNRQASQTKKTERARQVAAPAILRDAGFNAFEVVRRATSQIWAGDRDDVMSLMFVAIAEGRLKLADVSAGVDEFLGTHRHRPRALGDARFSLDNTPAEFTAIIKKETPEWAKVIKDAGIKLGN
jgi:hypothetical protein